MEYKIRNNQLLHSCTVQPRWCLSFIVRPRGETFSTLSPPLALNIACCVTPINTYVKIKNLFAFYISRGFLLAELLCTKGRISKGLHVVTESVSSVLSKEHWESFYGTKIRQHQFLLDNEITPLNHNGNVPRSVLAVQRKFQVGQYDALFASTSYPGSFHSLRQ